MLKNVVLSGFSMERVLCVMEGGGDTVLPVAEEGCSMSMMDYKQQAGVCWNY